METDNGGSAPQLITLDPDAGLVTTINTYPVTPERAEEALRYLVEAADKVMADVPGFVSFSYHLSFDRTAIVNYGQWANRKAIGAARHNPAVTKLIAETEEIVGKGNSKPFDLRATVRAGGA